MSSGTGEGCSMQRMLRWMLVLVVVAGAPAQAEAARQGQHLQRSGDDAGHARRARRARHRRLRARPEACRPAASPSSRSSTAAARPRTTPTTPATRAPSPRRLRGGDLLAPAVTETPAGRRRSRDRPRSATSSTSPPGRSGSADGRFRRIRLPHRPHADRPHRLFAGRPAHEPGSGVGGRPGDQPVRDLVPRASSPATPRTSCSRRSCRTRW